MPLQGKARKENNSIFLNLQGNLQPYEDQWNFLKELKRIDTGKLDQLYSEFTKEKNILKTNKSGILSIKLGEQIQISKSNLPKALTIFLRDNLNFLNIDYIVKKKIGLSVYGVEKYFKLVESNEEHVIIPRGFLDDLTHFLDDNKIKFTVTDNRIKVSDIDYSSNIRLYEYQKAAVEKLLAKENGILVAPPGSGKTVIGIELISRRRQPTLILVHKKQILNQWIERIENFLNIPKREIGKFASGKKKIGTSVTVAMVQTLNRLDDIQKLSDKVGMIIVDECHHIPAKMFRNVITKFKPHYLYGLTATPERKYNDEKLIYIHLGQVIHTIQNDFNQNESPNRLSIRSKEIKVILKETNLFVPFKIKTDDFQILSKVITFDSQRNQQIVGDLERCVEKKYKCLVLSERKEHLQVLNYYIKREYDTIVLTGDLTESQRKMKIKQIQSNNFQILLATGQLVGEGTDFDNLDCLFLVYPFAFSGKLTQYIGRIQRGNTRNKYIYDYRDQKVDFLENLFRKRLRYYKKHFK